MRQVAGDPLASKHAARRHVAWRGSGRCVYGDTCIQAAIARIRNRLLAEHLDVPVRDVSRAIAKHGRLNAVIDADIECGFGLLRVVATHLGLSATERSMQVRTLLAAFDTSELPVILLGDINEWFIHGRALRALVTHFRRAPAPRTFPTRWPVFALDLIWVHPGEWLIDVSVHRTALSRVASDHLPLIARIRAERRCGKGPEIGEIRSLPR